MDNNQIIQGSNIPLPIPQVMSVSSVGNRQEVCEVKQLRLIAPIPEEVPDLLPSFVCKLTHNLDPNLQTQPCWGGAPLTFAQKFEDFFKTPGQKYELPHCIHMSFSAFCQEFLPEKLKRCPESCKDYIILIEEAYKQGELEEVLMKYKEALNLPECFPDVEAKIATEVINASIVRDLALLKLRYQDFYDVSEINESGVSKNVEVLGEIKGIVSKYVPDPVLQQKYALAAIKRFNSIQLTEPEEQDL